MKNDYLDELKQILTNHNVSESDINDIMNDYTQMYDDGLDKSMSDTEIRELLGEPRRVYEDLKDTLSFIVKNHKDHKLVALSPFIALITFMTIGFTTQIWHPTWLIFLIIPILGVLSGGGRDKIIGLMPFISLITVILVGTYLGYYEYAWLAFLSIPMVALILHPSKKNTLMFSSFVIAILFYVYIVYTQGDILIGLLGFLLPVALGIYFERIRITVDFDRSRKGIMIFSTLIILLAIFITVGLLVPNSWVYAWQILLLFPIAAIIISGEFRLVAVMPFISTIIFFSVGYFFDMFYISWLAFLLIPMTGILDDGKPKKHRKHLD
ncbi:MAG: DUF1700 domain-containing protein [Acholeplasmataceae bacterium]